MTSEKVIKFSQGQKLYESQFNHLRAIDSTRESSSFSGWMNGWDFMAVCLDLGIELKLVLSFCWILFTGDWTKNLSHTGVLSLSHIPGKSFFFFFNQIALKAIIGSAWGLGAMWCQGLSHAHIVCYHSCHSLSNTNCECWWISMDSFSLLTVKWQRYRKGLYTMYEVKSFAQISISSQSSGLKKSSGVWPKSWKDHLLGSLTLLTLTDISPGGHPVCGFISQFCALFLD